MRTIKLLRLALLNFKGIRNLEIDARGENLSIYGDNGTGKTTIADAFSWLLFGKDSAGRSDFEIKTLDENGNAIHFIDHSVNASLLIDGNEITLEKILREKWVRQRGSLDREFQGHETEYIIDGIPKSKTEYTAFIKSIADEDVFRLLANPMYFNNNVDKKKRREMLFDIIGEVSDADVIAENSQILGDLAGAIGLHTADELKAATVAKKRRISADLQAIPNRIDEANRFITDSEENPDILSERMRVLESEIESKNEYLRELTTDTVADEYRRKARAEIRELENIASEEIENARRERVDYSNAVYNAEASLRSIERKIAELNRNNEAILRTVKHSNDKLETLREEWQRVFASTYTHDGKCHACGQDLPAEKIAEATRIFNENKARKLEEINEEAERIKSNISDLEQSLEENDEAIRENKKEYAEVLTLKNGFMTAVTEAQARLDEISAKHNAVIAEKKKALEEWKKTRTEGDTVSEERKTIEGDIKALTERKNATMEAIITLRNNERYKARIAELEADARRLSAEYEKLEREDYLLGEFTKLKASMLEERINRRFRFVKFKLFEQQINGGVVETCEATYDGVPYSVLNNAMKINIGLDIINAFSEHYGISAVIFLDNAESVTRIFDTQSQQIRLYVSEYDKTLRIENI